MKSLETDKVCIHLDTIKGFGFVCKLDKIKNPKHYSAAKCMLDPHSRAYILAEMCEDFKETK
jgi:hypothetical protein